MKLSNFTDYINENNLTEGKGYYIKVALRDAKKALSILDDMYRRKFDISGSDTYYFKDESMAYDAKMDLAARDIEITDTNIEESIINEDGFSGDPIHVLEKGLKQITRQPVSVSDRDGKEYRAKWAYMKSELNNSAWNKALDFIEDQGGTIDTDKSDNYYEANWDRGEPAEAVPTIYFTLR